MMIQAWCDGQRGNSPWTSFWAIFCVRMRDDRRRTSPLNTHSCTGKSSPVRMMGFLLLSSTTSDVLALFCVCWFCGCCCGGADGDPINLWLLKILLALLLLFALEAENVPVAASSSGSSKSSSLLGLLSLRRERIFSPVIFLKRSVPTEKKRVSPLTMTLLAIWWCDSPDAAPQANTGNCKTFNLTVFHTTETRKRICLS